MQKARRHTFVLRPLVGAWFQGLFHSSVRGSFHLSFTVLVRYRSRRFAPDFSCPGLLRCPFDFLRISLTGLSPSMATISIVFCYARSCLCHGSFYPDGAVTSSVWALPRSLATTCGIIVIFSSCGYLDVSVPRVCLPPCGIVIADWVAPFGDLRVTGYLRLSVTFRSLSRPSSPPRA